MATDPPPPATAGRRLLLPSEFMKERRPHLFSDTRAEDQPTIAREVFDHHLDTLTSRKQEIEFEYFSRRLAERTIRPNLRPQTGPTGGGDSKVDSETYPVSEEISQRWYLGEPAAGRERWAFAFSAKKRWKQKVRDDVANIISTGREYTRIYFITNQYAREKDRAELEDKLTCDNGIPLTILDRTWIIEQVIDRKLIGLAIEALGMTAMRVNRIQDTGPRDTGRLAELQELDAQIEDPERYRDTPYALAEDSLRAALLSRGLGRPRPEIDGRFSQAKRVAEQAGFRQQQSRIAYNHAWTTYFWFDDFHEFINLLDQVEALAIGSDSAADIEDVVTLYSLARSAVGNGYLTQESAGTEARRTRLVSELERISAIEARPTNALEARTSLLILRMGDALYETDVAPVFDEVWSGLREILGTAKGLAAFDLERIFDLISEVGEHTPESESFDIMFEEMVDILESRKSEGEGGKAYVKCACQKLEKGFFYEAIRYFGRASDRLFVKEYEADLVLALIGSSYAYEDAGLNWAARNYALAAATHGVTAFERHGRIGPYTWGPLGRLAIMEAKLGRVPQFLAAYELQMILWSQGAVTDEQQSQMSEERISYDVLLGSMLLATRLADLPRLTRLPDALGRLGLPNARVALLRALGHDNTLHEEGSIPAGETEQEIEKFFEDWAQRKEQHDLSEKPEYSLHDTVELSSVVIGCTFSVFAANDPTAVTIAESFLGALESLLSTSLEHRMLPQVDRLQITVQLSSDHTGLPALSFETIQGTRQAVITHGTALDFGSRKELEVYPEWLSRTVLEVAASVFSILRPEEWAERVLGEERGFARAITFSNVPVMTGNVFGSRAKTKADDWIRDDDRSYPLRREVALPASSKHTTPATPLEFGEGEPPPELLDRSKLRHSDVRVISVIDTTKWDMARWVGVFFQHTDDVERYSPILGLLFRERAPAKDIFAALQTRLGKVDERKALRVAIIRDVSADHRSHYAVVISPRYDCAELLRPDKQFVVISRINRMTPPTTENLDRFLEVYKRSGRYILAAGIIRGGDGEPDLLTENGVVKYDLEVRSAWQIGVNDPDIVALDPDNPPAVPAIVVDAPVLGALEWLKSRERGPG